jgi:TonB family protein
MAARENTPLESLDTLNFGVRWARPDSSFLSSLKAAFTGPNPSEWPDAPEPDSPMRVTWVSNPVPGRAITASSLSHVAIVLILLLPIWKILRWERPPIAAPDLHLTWDMPAADLPPISSPVKLAPKTDPADTAPSSDADAYHPRQTILSQPQVITHPRQTLIQPDAPPTPPKIAPPLPNIVEWGAAAPPRLRITPSELKPILRSVREDAVDAPQIRSATAHSDSFDLAQAPSVSLKMPASSSATPVIRARKAEDAVVPEIENRAPDSGALNIAPSALDVPRPRLQATASTARIAPSKSSDAEVAAAPEISGAASRGSVSAAGRESPGGDASLRRLIALSATPAPPTRPVEVPSGNLSARISVSPDGNHAGAGAKANGATGNGATGPPGIYISSSRPGASSPVSGSGAGANGGLKPVAPRLAVPRSTKPALPDANSESTPNFGPRDLSGLDADATPEKILSGKRIYTAYINLPNLTSAKGSLILNFAELQPSGSPTHVHTDLAAPTVLVTVDPKYPTSTIKQHIEGEVVLYAIIRENGTVDSIQVVKRLDSQLDRNAIEAVSGWKFAPASRNGEPIAVEAVIHVPFNATPVR